MQVAITAQEKIVSKKDGVEYVKIHGFTKKGKAVSAFLASENSEIPLTVVPSKDQLEEAFELLPIVNVEFNEQGRVEEASLLEEDEDED